MLYNIIMDSPYAKPFAEGGESLDFYVECGPAIVLYLVPYVPHMVRQSSMVL